MLACPRSCHRSPISDKPEERLDTQWGKAPFVNQEQTSPSKLQTKQPLTQCVSGPRRNKVLMASTHWMNWPAQIRIAPHQSNQKLSKPSMKHLKTRSKYLQPKDWKKGIRNTSKIWPRSELDKRHKLINSRIRHRNIEWKSGSRWLRRTLRWSNNVLRSSRKKKQNRRK